MTQSIESSLAFLQIQKSSNLKRARAGARNDDVFRIFRRTGQRIALIAHQIERERCTYLKNSYTEKNQLYKEFSAILRSNKDSAETHLADECLSDRNERRERKRKAEIRRINVNVLKRCECCRRLALRVQENNEEECIKGEDGEEDECTKHAESNAENNKSDAGQEDSNQENKEKVEAWKSQEPTLIDPSANVAKPKQGHIETVKVQFCCPPSQDIQAPANPKSSPSGMAVLKTPAHENCQYNLRRGTVSSLGTTSLASPSLVKSEGSVGPGSSGHCRRGQGARSTSLRKTINSPWLKHSISPAPLETMDKVKLQGQAWQEHVRTLQSRNKEHEGKPTAALPDAYEAFRKLVRAMEAKDKKKDQELLRLEMECYPEDEWSNSRPLSTTSSARWQPLKRTSVCHDPAFSEANFIRIDSRAADRELDNWTEEGEGKRFGDKQKDGEDFQEQDRRIFLTD